MIGLDEKIPSSANPGECSSFLRLVFSFFSYCLCFRMPHIHQVPMKTCRNSYYSDRGVVISASEETLYAPFLDVGLWVIRLLLTQIHLNRHRGGSDSEDNFHHGLHHREKIRVHVHGDSLRSWLTLDSCRHASRPHHDCRLADSPRGGLEDSQSDQQLPV